MLSVLSRLQSSVLSCLIRIRKWSTEERAALRVRVWSHGEDERLGCSSCKRAGSEWRRSPRGQPTGTFSFFHISAFNSLYSPLTLQSMVEFRMGLHFPGHHGCWRPLPLGLGRPRQSLLEENTDIINQRENHRLPAVSVQNPAKKKSQGCKTVMLIRGVKWFDLEIMT